MLEIDGDPHTVSFLDPEPGVEAPTIFRLRTRDGLEARVGPFPEGPVCNCRSFTTANGCRHVRALIAARLMPAQGWAPVGAGGGR